MKKITLVFQGDSITDAGRDYRNYHNLGFGYPKYAAEYISSMCPDVDIEFINLGISGNRTSQLFDRLYNDCISFNPDVVSILVGINDAWHRHNNEKILTTDAQLELNYRSILTRIKNETHAKIVMISPYVLDHPSTAHLNDDLVTILPIVRRLAEEFADVYIPLDEMFDRALLTQPEPYYYSADGVHPNENGAKFIGEQYAAAVAPIIKDLF